MKLIICMRSCKDMVKWLLSVMVLGYSHSSMPSVAVDVYNNQNSLFQAFVLRKRNCSFDSQLNLKL